MAIVKPFKGVRPAEHLAASIAALPYDVYTRQEAKAIVENNPLSFLKIDRAETQFPDETDMYSQAVYDKARDTLAEMINDHSFIQDTCACYYLYALTMNGKTQTGIVGCASIDDYLSGMIRKHENTREDKELDRIRHVDTVSAHTGPIFLAHRTCGELDSIKSSVKAGKPLYDFTCSDNVRHQVWKISSPEMTDRILHIFSEMKHIYIADGHHRAASAVRVGLKRRATHPDYTGDEEFNYFLSVLFSEEELHIYDYNRVVTGLNGYTSDSFLSKLSEYFAVEEVSECQSGIKNPPDCQQCNERLYLCRTDEESQLWHPRKKGEFGLYLDKTWYKLTAKESLYSDNPVGSLDVSILQDTVLAPLLDIRDPKTDSRIKFVGGIRGMKELERLADEKPERIAFVLYPTSMKELLAVADAGLLMPPKSTWFEPKLRSGLFIHKIE